MSKDSRVIKEVETIGHRWVEFEGSCVAEISLFKSMIVELKLINTDDTKVVTRDFVIDKIRWCRMMINDLLELL